ncbi:PREDICTED: cytochrome P450 714A1-like [Nelumbo nucifera]|uniref:Cytochrome P450 714A1-like n=2 Tax=Nelumbo nucifera TaxID=4432 RepID=A0A1U8BND0_NELNU|nr:PREDICTED: cytochrome P450 714A1-like [Nelumbo nucifera]DAD38548.1 TPA_asm: hypothetical protein HUJ06_012870 [Nelumbo nucifera]
MEVVFLTVNHLFWSMTTVVVVVVVVSLVMYVYSILWLKPEKLREKLRIQGITGPPPCFLRGNVPEMKRIQAGVAAASPSAANSPHDYASILFPYLEQWRKQYGQIYMYSTGTRQHLLVNHPDLVKEMSLSVSWDLGKPLYMGKTLGPMLGNGILRSNGNIWAHQRRIIAPEFFMDKVKGMMDVMVDSALSMLKKWEDRVEMEGGMADVKVDQDLRNFSADVISRTCFGSSYLKGKEIFSKLRALQVTLSKQGFLFWGPAYRNLPTKRNREIRRLERQIESLILKVIKERKEEASLLGSSAKKDLLEMILEGAINGDGHHDTTSIPCNRFIVDNCKNIYFAGHESTAVAAAWCLMLLALYPQWQDRVRAEVVQICGDHRPLDADALQKMKTMKMVIQETLRLYSPAPFLAREVFQDTKIGHIVVPKGVHLWTLIPTLHRDPDIWGEDAHEFKPDRFSNGISEACKLPQAYVPFGVGARMCLGRNFAMVELMVVLSLIISNFSFSLSPTYRHSPSYRMILEPEYGVHLLIRKI